MYWMVEYQRERFGGTVQRCYSNKDDAIAAAKDSSLFRATVWEYPDDGSRLFVMGKIKG